MKAWARGANLRRRLRRPDCPEVIRQFKHLFDKAFSSSRIKSITANDQTSSREMAHHIHSGFRYSRSSTHLGNSLIFYYPSKKSSESTVGSIKKIYHESTGRVYCEVERQMPLPPTKHDPFRRFPLFPAITYSSRAYTALVDKVYFEDVIAHASRFDFSHDRSVFVNMSRA